LEDFGVVKVASTALFAEAVHVIPAEPASDVLQLTVSALDAETHIEVRAALVDVPAGTVSTLRNMTLTFSQTPRMK